MTQLKVSGEVLIQNKLGLHARAAAQLVNLTAQFQSEISLIKGKQNVNAKSIMGVLMLAAAKGSKLTVIAEGEDAQAAFEAVQDLVNRKFGEAE